MYIGSDAARMHVPSEYTHTYEGRYNEVGRSPNCNNGAELQLTGVLCSLVYCTSPMCAVLHVCLSLSLSLWLAHTVHIVCIKSAAL
jgi:hypothetical protein